MAQGRVPFPILNYQKINNNNRRFTESSFVSRAGEIIVGLDDLDEQTRLQVFWDKKLQLRERRYEKSR